VYTTDIIGNRNAADPDTVTGLIAVQLYGGIRQLWRVRF